MRRTNPFAVATSMVALVTSNCLHLPAFAQTPTQQPTEGGLSKASPLSGVGENYGTSNLAKPNAVVINPGPQELIKLQTLSKEVQKDQELRKQPPRGRQAFATYMGQDPMLERYAKILDTNPSLDATLLTVLAWNHVALDMTSIDHTTQGGASDPADPTKKIFESTYGEQFGPPRSSRAMAIVHMAMFEAANIVDKTYASYRAPSAATDLQTDILSRLGPGFDPSHASEAAAISAAAYQALIALYPNKTALLDVSKLRIAVLVGAQEKAKGGDSAGRVAMGTTLGEQSAVAILAIRSNDNSNKNHQSDDNCKPVHFCFEDSFPSPPRAPAKVIDWTEDPVSKLPVKLGSDWLSVSPFVYDSAAVVTDTGIKLLSGKMLVFPKPPNQKFTDSLKKETSGKRPDPHGGVKPMADTPANQGTLDLYVYGSVAQVPNGPAKMVPSAYSVQVYGGLAVPADVPLAFPPGQGDRFLTPTKRTQAQTVFAQFWGYDAVALLCAPPRLYNMIATSIALDHVVDGKGPRTGVAMAHYLALTNMALADAAIAGWGGKYRYNIARPVTYLRAENGGNDPNWVSSKWTPFGQVATNGQPLGTTPPFPRLSFGPCGLRWCIFPDGRPSAWFAKDAAASNFDFVSDEYNGETFGADGRARPFMKVHYATLEGAKWENAESRIFLGVHWQQDGDDGVALGNDIADRMFATTMKKLH